jgi:PAS domain S-box-containing protein
MSDPFDTHLRLDCDELSAYKYALDEAAIVAITDQKGIIIHANDNFCAISKYAREELIGQDHRIINSGYHGKEFIRELWRTIANGLIWRGEMCNRAKDGSIYWVDTTIVPFLNDKGKPFQYLAIRADIGPRKQAEEQLERSLRETSDYRYALNESAIVAITDQKGIIIHANDNFCAISKFDREELIGQDHRIIKSGYHGKEFIQGLWKTIANGRIWRGEMCNRAKDGSIYWVDTTIVPFLNDKGKPFQYLAIRADITERKAAEEKLLKVNRLYSFLSAINQSIVHITDTQELLDGACSIATGIGAFKMAWAGLINDDGTLRIVSAAGDRTGVKQLKRLSGSDFSKGELRSTQPGQVLANGQHAVCNHVLEDPLLKPWHEQYERIGIASCLTLPIKRFGKVVGVFQVDSHQPDFFDKEEVALLLESVGDISFALENYTREEQRLLNERERERLHELHRLMADNTTDLVALHDPKGEFLYVSPSCEDMLGYEAHELIGTSPYDLMHPDDMPLVRSGIHEGTLQGRTDGISELRLRHRKGHYVWLETRSTPIFGPDGTKVVKMQSSSRNITERKRNEERIRQSQAFTAGVLNSLSAHIAVAASDGTILSVNEAWRQFGRDNGVTALERTCEGSNYFEVCTQAIEASVNNAAEALQGMKDVLSGKLASFYMEYPCHAPSEERWFGMRVMRFESDESMIVIAHENITNVKKAEQERDRTLLELEERVLQRTEELNNRNKNITDSINYAKRIQDGLLPRHSMLKEMFRKSFIMYEPQNIVSGDFFWCHESRGRKIVVVADCTGHGVPGALMSIIGNNLLNRIVVHERIENPSEILELLDQRLRKALESDTYQVQDGMDVCLCVIDTHFNELYFSGALRPLFIADNEGAVTEVKGSRCTVGGDSLGTPKQFEMQRYPITHGQRIYLCSDGYYSQFGGPRDKKFQKSRFKRTLAGIQNLTMRQQEAELRQMYLHWAGPREQVDDVLVVGIEL